MLDPYSIVNQVMAPACTLEQLQDLLGDPLETALMFSLTYGLRRSEVCGLRWNAVDMEAGELHIRHMAVVANGKVLYSDSTKTATSNRLLPLTAPHPPHFVTRHFRRTLEAKGCTPIRFRNLEHSVVNTLRKGGCDPKDIQARLGHSDVSTTLNVYGHVLRDDMSRLGNVVDTALFQGVKAG